MSGDADCGGNPGTGRRRFTRGGIGVGRADESGNQTSENSSREQFMEDRMGHDEL